MARSEKNLTAVFTDTANAIRSKTGTTETICPLDFADKINSIETGGGGTGGNDRLHAFVAAGGGFGGTHLPSDDNDINKYIYPEDYERLTNCSYKFSNSNINYLPNIDYTKIKYITNMFENDKNLVFRTTDKNGNLLPIFTMQLNGVIELKSMFAGCTSLSFVNLSIAGGSNNSYSGENMFNGAYLKDVDLKLKDCPCALMGMFENVKTVTKGDNPEDENYGNFDSFNIVWDYTPGYIYTVFFDKMFYEATNLIDAPYFTIPKFNGGCSFKFMFSYSEALRTIPAYDLSTTVDGDRNSLLFMVSGCSNLEEFHATGIKCDLDLSSSTRFTREALLEVLNNLATITSTMTLELGSTNLAKLTDEDKAIAINKGWTLA